MSQRVERVASEVRGVLGEVLARDEIKDPRVRGAGLITVTHVRVSGDLQHARASFTVHGLDDAALERVRVGLNHASGYFRQAISRRLRMKVAPAVTFVVDQVFEQAAHVEQLLRELHPVVAKTEAPAAESNAEVEASDVEDSDAGEPDDKE
jgi:ribosome-binding factor A